MPHADSINHPHIWEQVCGNDELTAEFEKRAESGQFIGYAVAEVVDAYRLLAYRNHCLRNGLEPFADESIEPIARLYFRYIGAPQDRPGGPWWYKDFMNEGDARSYHAKHHDSAIVAEAQLVVGALPSHGPMDIAPPENARKLEM